MKWFTKQSVHIVFIALGLLIATLGSLFYFQTNRASVTGGLVIESYKVMEHIEVLFRQIKDAEGHVFNYVITGNATDRDHYQAIIAHEGHDEHEANYEESLDENLQALHTLMGSEPDQLLRLDQLRPLLQQEKN